jgi:hypothetical protein
MREYAGVHSSGRDETTEKSSALLQVASDASDVTDSVTSVASVAQSSEWLRRLSDHVGSPPSVLSSQ